MYLSFFSVNIVFNIIFEEYNIKYLTSIFNNNFAAIIFNMKIMKIIKRNIEHCKEGNIKQFKEYQGSSNTNLIAL
jgi:hypothetical protein